MAKVGGKHFLMVRLSVLEKLLWDRWEYSRETESNGNKVNYNDER